MEGKTLTVEPDFLGNSTWGPNAELKVNLVRVQTYKGTILFWLQMIRLVLGETDDKCHTHYCSTPF